MAAQPMAASNARIPAQLDWLNFFLADVRDGLGPYLAIYLLAVQKWDEASIGAIMSVAGIAAILTQTPAGAFIDRTKGKRGVIVAAAVATTACCALLPLFPGFWPVALTQALSGAAGSVFQPAIAAITLGTMGPKVFTRRNGRNEAFNHAGNAFAAIAAGGLAYFFGPVVVFYLLAAMAIASCIVTLTISPDAIDADLARGLHEDGSNTDQPSGLRVLLNNRPLLVFAVCMVLFHFANAAMLPLVGQKLTTVNKELGTTLMSVCIVAAQLVMIPVALIVGAKADAWGRKPIFIGGFLVLALRGALYTLSDNPFWLVSVQALDGVGAGIFGACFPVVVNDITKGSGHFNVSQGAIVTATGIGGALSTSVAGAIVVSAGYSCAFLVLAAIAAAGLVLFVFMMPETKSGPR